MASIHSTWTICPRSWVYKAAILLHPVVQGGCIVSSCRKDLLLLRSFAGNRCREIFEEKTVDFHALPLLMHTYLCLQLVHSMLTANCEARLGFKKQELSEFGSGAYGLSVDPNAIWGCRRILILAPLFCGAFSTSTAATPSIRLVCWCFLLNTGIVVPSTHIYIEEPIQEFHYLSENSEVELCFAGGLNDYFSDYPSLDYLNNGSRLPGNPTWHKEPEESWLAAGVRQFFGAGGVATTTSASPSPSFLLYLFEIHVLVAEFLLCLGYTDPNISEYHLAGTIPLQEFRREVPP